MRKIAILIVAALSAAVLAQSADPVKTLQELQAFQQSEIEKARAEGRRVDFEKMQGEVRARVEAAMKGVDPKKVEAKQGLAWARLAAQGEMNSQIIVLTERYLNEASPNGDDKFDAQMLHLQAAAALNDGKRVAAVLPTVRPPDAARAQMLAAVTVYELSDVLVKSQGADAALKALDQVERGLPAPGTDARAQAMQLNMKMAFAEQRADILNGAGRRAEALQVLNDFRATLPADSPMRRSVNGKTKQIELVGQPAPGLSVERGYGGFKSLADLKGKVVLVDFFAHWCGPCIAAFPELIEMYSALKGQGLEIVGFTTYYGYYKSENREKRDMAKDVEFGKMKEFIGEHKLPWPVAYGERANFEAYGVTGIPHVAVIDRKGVLRKIKIGYSPDTFPAFRAEIEKLLNEKP